MKRRKALKGIIGIAGAAILTGVYSYQVEPFWLKFEHRKLPIQSLPPSLHQKSIIQISDIHVGDRFDWNFIINSFERAKALKPDIVVYTGDYITYDNANQIEQLKKVMQHAVRGKLDTVGILGNHDYGFNWSNKSVANNVVEILEKSGISVLRNQSKVIAGVNMIGLDDYWGPNFEPRKAFKNYDSKNANLVLCHNPDVCDLDVWNGYKGWILSGHTHGGQCKPPFLNPPLLPVKNVRYASGEVDLADGRMLYVNSALGHLRQVRFNVRPEITVFEMLAV